MKHTAALFLLYLATCCTAEPVDEAMVQLGDADYAVREQATGWLVSQGEPMLERMVRLYRVSDDEEARARARRVALRIHQSLPKGYFGISLGVEQLGVGRSARCVIRVEEVMPDSPARQAGLLADDLIEEIDGQQFIGNRQQWIDRFRILVQELRPGGQVRLTVSRGAELLQLPLTVGARPEPPPESETQQVFAIWWARQLARPSAADTPDRSP